MDRTATPEELAYRAEFGHLNIVCLRNAMGGWVYAWLQNDGRDFDPPREEFSSFAETKACYDANGIVWHTPVARRLLARFSNPTPDDPCVVVEMQR